MLNVGEIVLDLKTGGTGLVINLWADNTAELDLVLLNGKQVIITRNIADLEQFGRYERRRGRW
jgi:hypothetical protein